MRLDSTCEADRQLITPCRICHIPLTKGTAQRASYRGRWADGMGRPYYVCGDCADAIHDDMKQRSFAAAMPIAQMAGEAA